MVGTGNASDKFWELEERIRKDKKHPGVMIELSKVNMICDIVALINSGVITDGMPDFARNSVAKRHFAMNVRIPSGQGWMLRK